MTDERLAMVGTNSRATSTMKAEHPTTQPALSSVRLTIGSFVRDHCPCKAASMGAGCALAVRK
jgi:hypothetical protein